MPTYEYRCNACGEIFEEWQGINEPPLVECVLCKAPGPVRLIGKGGAVLFKGEGFHATDYRSEEYRRRAAADGADNG